MNTAVLLRSIAAISIALCVGVDSQDEKKSSLDKAYSLLIEAMGDESQTLAYRKTAFEMLARGKKGAISLLISHLSDPRVFDRAYIGPSAPADGAIPEVLTVGGACSDILYLIIRTEGKSKGIANWQDWWTLNKNRSYEEILEHEAMRNKENKQR